MSLRLGVVVLTIAYLSILFVVGCGKEGQTYEVNFEDTFIVNRGPKSYVKAQVVLAANNEDAKKVLEKHKNQLRDIIIGVLAAELPKTENEASKARKLHKDNIAKAINESSAFPQSVQEVYFTEYIWQ